MRHDVTRIGLLAAMMVALLPQPAAAQSPTDAGDASIATEDSREAPLAPPMQRPSSSTPAPGAAARPQPSPSGSAIGLRAVRVDGATRLAPTDFESATRHYVGRPLDPADLRSLATDVANVARRAGYGLATAWIPKQKVDGGVLVVRIDEGRIDSVETEGEAAGPVRALLAPLANGRPVRSADLERRLLIAGDLAGVTVGKPKLDRRPGRNVLRVQTHRNRVAGRASLDNWGSSEIGPLRLRVDLDVNGLLSGNDRLSFGGVVTPAQPEEFQFVRLGYSRGIGLNGTQLSIDGYYGRSRPGGAVATGDLDGRSLDLAATLSHPFKRSRAASLWGSLELAVRDTDLDRAGTRVRQDRLAMATASVNGVAKAGPGWIRSRLAVVQGLKAFGATRRGDPLASRADADGSFTKIEFSAQYSRPLARRLSLQLGMEGQISSRPVLASEEMGLGGRAFLRGYDYRETSGDTGAAASAELRFDLAKLPRPVARAQVYTYADAGRVTNLRGGSGGDSLASAGGGVRVSLKNGIDVGAELGVPLADSRLHADPRPRFSFTIGARF